MLLDAMFSYGWGSGFEINGDTGVRHRIPVMSWIFVQRIFIQCGWRTSAPELRREIRQFWFAWVSDCHCSIEQHV